MYLKVRNFKTQTIIIRGINILFNKNMDAE
jgi:hypothetical protein